MVWNLVPGPRAGRPGQFAIARSPVLGGSPDPPRSRRPYRATESRWELKGAARWELKGAARWAVLPTAHPPRHAAQRARLPAAQHPLRPRDKITQVGVCSGLRTPCGCPSAVHFHRRTATTATTPAPRRTSDAGSGAAVGIPACNGCVGCPVTGGETPAAISAAGRHSSTGEMAQKAAPQRNRTNGRRRDMARLPRKPQPPRPGNAVSGFAVTQLPQPATLLYLNYRRKSNQPALIFGGAAADSGRQFFS